MRYRPPKKDDKSQWVPVVVKDKDWLVGYISGIQLIESLIADSLQENGIEINLKGIDLCLDSSRFNDILENGKRESSCSKEEIKNYYRDLIEEKITMVKEKHPDNYDVFDGCFLEVECSCGLGIYSFKTPQEVPDKQFRCQICGNVIIDYTGYDDEEFDYDGNLNSKAGVIIDELTEDYKEDLDDDDEDSEEF